MLIRMVAGHKKGVEEKVVWIDSQTKETVLNGIRDAKPLSAYNNLTAAGYMRGIEDYSLGINFQEFYLCFMEPKSMRRLAPQSILQLPLEES